MKILSISEASLFLEINKTTLRRWNLSGYLKPKYRTNKNILLNQNSQQLTSNNKNSQRN